MDVDYLEGGPEDHDVPGWLYPGLAVYLDWDLRVDVYLDMTALHYPDGGPQAALDLSEMDDTLHSNYLQHPVPVVGLGELLVLLRAPDVGPGAPAHDVEDDNSLYRRQINLSPVHFKFDVLVEIFAHSLPLGQQLTCSDHRIDTLERERESEEEESIESLTFVVYPGRELLRILLPPIVEVKAEFSVQPEPEVIVHNEYLGIIFICQS